MRILKSGGAAACEAKVKLVFEDKRFADFLGYEQEQTLFLSMHEGMNFSNLKDYDERLNYAGGRVDYKTSYGGECIDIKFYEKCFKLKRNFTYETDFKYAFERRIKVGVESTDYDECDTNAMIDELAARLTLLTAERLSQ